MNSNDKNWSRGTNSRLPFALNESVTLMFERLRKNKATVDIHLKESFRG